MRSRWMTVGLLAVGLLFGSRPALGAKPSLKEAVRLFDNLEDEQAERMLRSLLKADPPPAVPDQARIHLYFGLIDLNALRVDSARDEFRQALRLEATLELPRGSSPKARKMFKEVQDELTALVAAPKPAPAPPPPPPVAPAEVPVVVENQAPPAPPTPPPAGPSHVGSAVVGVVAVGAAAAGVVFGVLGQSSLNSADGAKTVGSASSLAQQTQTDWIVADVCYGAAGAAAIAAVILFFTEKPSAPSASAFVAPTPGGAALGIAGTF